MAESAQPDPNSPSQAGEESGARMSFFEHLVDLRKRLVNSLLGIGLGMVVGLAISPYFIDFIVRPMQAALRAHQLDDKLYYTSPAGYVGLIITLGLYLGMVVAMPWVLLQIWQFVAPGLYKHERNAVAGFIIPSMFLFLGGIAFGYFIVLPTMLNFLIGMSTTGPVKPLISINEYFDLILIVLIGLGIIFELPVVIFILSVFGIVTPKFLIKNFRYAMLIITILAAFAAPTPDATTMLIFMAALVLLYVVGVIVSYFVVRKKRSRALAGGEAQ